MFTLGGVGFFLFGGVVLWAIVFIPVWFFKLIRTKSLMTLLLCFISLIALIFSIKLMVFPFMDGIFGFRDDKAIQEIADKFKIGLIFFAVSLGASFVRFNESE